jgi:sulfite exporter TauE/SafE
VSPDYALALTTGLLGGFGHCLGMCGPIVAAVSFGAGAGRGPLPHAAYHAGRLLTYTFVGALMGFAGSFVNVAGRLAGVQDAVALIAGALMVLMGLRIAGVVRLSGRAAAAAPRWPRAVRRLADGEAPLALFPLGLLLGFLPCGLSATVFVMAAATADPLRGWTLALLFGVGTLPALALFGLAAGRLGARLRGALYRAGGVAIVAMGLLALRRGLAGHGGL